MSAPPLELVLAAVGGTVWWLAASARRARRARDRCDRYGHAPDPATLGSWRGERCARCGVRLR